VTPAELIGRYARPTVPRRAGSRWRGIVGALVVVLAAASLVFEQSPANEVLRTNAALRVIEDGGGPVSVGLVVAVITVGIELGSAVLITLGLHAEEGYVQRFKRTLVGRGRKVGSTGARRGRHRRTRALSRLAGDVAIALGLGAGLVTVRHHVLDAHPTIRRDLIVSVRATAIVAVVSGLIGYLAAGGISNAEKVGLGTPAQWVIDYGTDTRFWVTVLVVGYGAAFVVKVVRGRADRQARRLHEAAKVEPVAAAAAFEAYVAAIRVPRPSITPTEAAEAFEAYVEALTGSSTVSGPVVAHAGPVPGARRSMVWRA